MTRMSLVPKMVRVAGIDIRDFFTELIESAR
jgi:D-alanine-D-alanine ligase-like ATP-grasp enzyme